MTTPLLDEARHRLDQMRLQRRLVTVRLSGDIVAQAGGPGVCAIDIAEALRRDRHAPALIEIDSPGGNLAEALNIRDELRNHRGEVIADAVGRCHSAASVVLTGAAVRAAPLSARMLLHPPVLNRIEGDGWTADRLRALAQRLDQDGDRMAEIYAAASHAPAWWWQTRMQAGRPTSAHDLATAGLLNIVDGRQWTYVPWLQAQMERAA